MCKLSFSASMEKSFSTSSSSLWLHTAWTHANFTHDIFLNPQSVNCMGLWIKLILAGDFSPLHLSALFLWVPPPLKWWHIIFSLGFIKQSFGDHGYGMLAFNKQKIKFGENMEECDCYRDDVWLASDMSNIVGLVAEWWESKRKSLRGKIVKRM